MDPNVALERILDLAAQIQSGLHTPREMGHIAEDLAQAINDLDKWLRNGGVLPEEWKQNERQDTRNPEHPGTVLRRYRGTRQGQDNQGEDTH